MADVMVALATSPEERQVMALLTRRGHYEETPNGFEWANVDAVRIVEEIQAQGVTGAAVLCALSDVGLHDPAWSQDEADCLAGDLEEILGIFGGRQ